MSNEGSTSVTSEDSGARPPWHTKVLVRIRNRGTALEASLVAIVAITLMIAVAATVATPGPVAGFIDLAPHDPVVIGAGEPDRVRHGPLPAADDGGEVRVVESGFTPFAALGRNFEDHQVTWGVIVENSSATSAAIVDVQVGIVDDDGESALRRDDPPRRQLVGPLPPGTRIGLGGVDYVTGPDVAALEITLHEQEWWPAEPDCPAIGCIGTPPIGTFSVDLLGATRHREPLPSLTLEVRVESEYDRILHPVRIVGLFRDEAGAIMGGSPPDYGNQWAAVPPGWSIQRLEIHEPSLVEIVDPSRIDLYAHHAACC